MLDFSVFFAKGASGPRPMCAHGVLLRGARAAGKTSLAFQAAVNAVLDGGHVIVLCREALLYAKVPQPFVRLAALPPEALARIEFVYVEGWAAATAELMCLADAREVPALVLVDDDGFAHDAERQPPTSGGSSSGSMASCLSYLESMYAWLQRVAHSNDSGARDGRRSGFCYIVVSNALTAAATSGGEVMAATGGSGSSSSSYSGSGGHYSYYNYSSSSSSGSSSERLPLPYAAFPVVDVYFASPGVVTVTPPALDTTAQPLQLHLQWHGGLQLAS